MPRYSLFWLEKVKLVATELLQQFGPLEEKALCLFVNHKRISGDSRLSFLKNAHECYGAVEEVLDCFDEFASGATNGVYFVYLANKNTRPTAPPSTLEDYKDAYNRMVKRFDALKKEYLGDNFVETPEVSDSELKKGYYNITIQLEAATANPEIFDIPDYYVNTMLGLFDLSGKYKR